MLNKQNMHADEIETDVTLVRRLLSAQFPKWSDLQIEPVESYGTDHHIYRLGEELSVRLPCIGWATKQAAKEDEWMPKLVPHLPLALPAQLAMGKPGDGYPFDWSICKWLPGENANNSINDSERAAVDLAAFIQAMYSIYRCSRSGEVDHSSGRKQNVRSIQCNWTERTTYHAEVSQ